MSRLLNCEPMPHREHGPLTPMDSDPDSDFRYENSQCSECERWFPNDRLWGGVCEDCEYVPDAGDRE